MNRIMVSLILFTLFFYLFLVIVMFLYTKELYAQVRLAASSCEWKEFFKEYISLLLNVLRNGGGTTDI